VAPHGRRRLADLPSPGHARGRLTRRIGRRVSALLRDAGYRPLGSADGGR
jgi:hypothetical protein